MHATLQKVQEGPTYPRDKGRNNDENGYSIHSFLLLDIQMPPLTSFLNIYFVYIEEACDIHTFASLFVLAEQ
jgi:hypothetical protein